MATAVAPAELALVQAECARLKDGCDVRIRPTSPTDLDALRVFFATLSPETLTLRFLHQLRAVQESELRELTITDDRSHIALVAEPRSASGDQLTELIAEARCIRCGHSDLAELALVVADGWRRVGLGTMLMRALLRRAHLAGVRHLCGDALGDNTAIQGLVRVFGARFTVHRGSNTVRLCLESSGRSSDSLP